MPTLFDLDVLIVRPVRGSARAATKAYLLEDAAGSGIGNVSEQVGSSLALARRHLSSHGYRYAARFDVTDLAGAIEMVLTRRPVSALKTRVVIETALADGKVVAISTARSGSTPGYTASDAEGNAIAEIGQLDATTHTVTEPGGRPLGTIHYFPITRSPVNRSGSESDSYRIEYRPEAATRVRIATLATVIAQNSARRG